MSFASPVSLAKDGPLVIEKSMGFKWPRGLSRHKGRLKIPVIKELEQSWKVAVHQYGILTIEEILVSRELKGAANDIFNTYGARLWPDLERQDPNHSRFEWLVDARENDLNGFYPENLYFSVATHREVLRTSFCQWLVAKCRKYRENHPGWKAQDTGQADNDAEAADSPCASVYSDDDESSNDSNFMPTVSPSSTPSRSSTPFAATTRHPTRRQAGLSGRPVLSATSEYDVTNLASLASRKKLTPPTPSSEKKRRPSDEERQRSKRFCGRAGVGAGHGDRPMLLVTLKLTPDKLAGVGTEGSRLRYDSTSGSTANPPSAGHERQSLAKRILGGLADGPAVSKLLRHKPGLSSAQLQHLKKVVIQCPEARTSMLALKSALRGQGGPATKAASTEHTLQNTSAVPVRPSGTATTSPDGVQPPRDTAITSPSHQQVLAVTPGSSEEAAEASVQKRQEEESALATSDNCSRRLHPTTESNAEAYDHASHMPAGITVEEGLNVDDFFLMVENHLPATLRRSAVCAVWVKHLNPLPTGQDLSRRIDRADRDGFSGFCADMQSCKVEGVDLARLGLTLLWE